MECAYLTVFIWNFAAVASEVVLCLSIKRHILVKSEELWRYFYIFAGLS